jgi:anti-sigma factor RsiW
MLDSSPDCLEITQLLDGFRDNELPESEKQAVLTHLPTCEKCQGRLREIESVVASLRSLPRLEMPHSLQVDWNAYIERHANAGKETMSNAVPIKKKIEEANIVPITSAGKLGKRRTLLAAVAGLVLLVVAAGFIQHNVLTPAGTSLADKPTPNSPIKEQTQAPLIASKGGARQESGQRTVDGDLIALYSNETNFVSEDLGIATDEDGLYALKL